MAFLHLFRRFILRALLRERMRSAVAIAGIAMGVAVMVAIRLANSSVTDTFSAAVESVSGDASLRIRGSSGRFDELLLGELDWLRTYGQLSPVVETYAMVVDDRTHKSADAPVARNDMLHVLGVDVLLDFDLREYHVLKTGSGQEQTAREMLFLLKDSRSVILTERFLRAHDLRVGDKVPLVFGSRQQLFTIRGVLLNRGPARTLDGNFVLMDIAAAQLAAQRLGTLDYVDVKLADDAEPGQVLTEIQNRLPAGLVVEFPDAASSRADTMIAAFQFNLTALSGVALLVGLFLIYNTVAMSVAARRDEIGMLQAAGAGRRTVLLLFLGEAMVLATVGIGFGLPAGRTLAAYAVSGTAQTVETFYIAGIAQASATQLRLGPVDILMAVGFTLPLALLAAFFPAWDAASLEPIEAVRGVGRPVSGRRLRAVTVGAVFCLGLGWVMTTLAPVDGKPIFGFVAELMFMLSGALFTPAVLWCTCRGARSAVPRIVPLASVELRLASSNLLSSLPRVSVSVAALAVSLSMMIAIAVMVGSFRETVVYWLDSVLSADLTVKPAMQTSSVSEARLSKHAVDTIRKDPDVVETVSFMSRQIPFRDKTIRLTVTELEKARKRGRLLFKTPPDRVSQVSHAPDNSVLVSESFSILFHVDRGSMIEFPVSDRVATLRVDGVYYDYASNQGTVMLNAATYGRLFADGDPQPAPQHVSVYLRPDADPEQVRHRLVEKLGADEQVYCFTNGQVRTEAMRIFDSTFAVTYALQLIAIIIAGAGVASTLITLIYQRQREIGLLSLVGATYKQTRRVILFEAILLGGVSQLIGVGIGMLLATVLIYVINVQSFGWTIQFHLPLQFLATSTLSVLIASAMFGLYPAVRAANMDALKTVREE